MQSRLSMAIFGISGQTGNALAAEAVRRGHVVRGLVRPGSTYRAPGGVEIVKGNFGDTEAMDACLQGANAAFCVFAARTDTRDVFCEQAMADVLAGMQRRGIRRLICQTGAMAVPDRNRISLVMRWMSDLYRSQRPEMAADVAGEERRVRESQTEWTVVRPPRIKAAAASGKVALGTQVKVGMMSSIGLGDLAQVLVNLAEQRAYIRECVYVKEG